MSDLLTGNAMKKKRRRRMTAKTKLTRPKVRKRPSRRTIGQIITDGPSNADEERRLRRYQQLRDQYFETHFSDLDFSERLIQCAVNQAMHALTLVRSDFRHAIQTQHVAQSSQLLKHVAAKAREMLHQGSVQKHLQPKPDYSPGTVQLVGYGGYPANSCQECGRYLTRVCYSQIYNADRVPRTDKICAACFRSLSRNEKQQHHRYQYHRRPEPRGVGWNPDGEWGS